MKPLGIISGTLPMSGKGLFSDLQEMTLETPFGQAVVFCSNEIAFIPRHGKDHSHHILPHLINHAANLQALKEIGVGEVVGINSTGSLKRHLRPGMLVMPDDYLMPMAGPTTIREKPVHITPTLNSEARQRWLETAKTCAIEITDGGIYWQTAGPRLETKAEIAMMSQFADLVGMTMASEAIIAQELDLPYASLCSVDNYAHGIEEDGKKLDMESILWHAKRSAETILRILHHYLERNTRSCRPS
jgi:5'-methylthioadenosine phosphorylase